MKKIKIEVTLEEFLKIAKYINIEYPHREFYISYIPVGSLGGFSPNFSDRSGGETGWAKVSVSLNVYPFGQKYEWNWKTLLSEEEVRKIFQKSFTKTVLENLEVLSKSLHTALLAENLQEEYKNRSLSTHYIEHNMPKVLCVFDGEKDWVDLKILNPESKIDWYIFNSTPRIWRTVLLPTPKNMEILLGIPWYYSNPTKSHIRIPDEYEEEYNSKIREFKN